jgi:hypothetical protein
MLFPSDERDMPGARIDAVFNKFGNRFQRIALRESNNADRIPIISNA